MEVCGILKWNSFSSSIFYLDIVNNIIGCIDGDGIVNIYQIDTNYHCFIVATLRSPIEGSHLTSLKFNENGKYVSIGNSIGSVYIYRIEFSDNIVLSISIDTVFDTLSPHSITDIVWLKGNSSCVACSLASSIYEVTTSSYKKPKTLFELAKSAVLTDPSIIKIDNAIHFMTSGYITDSDDGIVEFVALVSHQSRVTMLRRFEYEKEWRNIFLQVPVVSERRYQCTGYFKNSFHCSQASESSGIFVVCCGLNVFDFILGIYDIFGNMSATLGFGIPDHISSDVSSTIAFRKILLVPFRHPQHLSLCVSIDDRLFVLDVHSRSLVSFPGYENITVFDVVIFGHILLVIRKNLSYAGTMEQVVDVFRILSHNLQLHRFELSSLTYSHLISSIRKFQFLWRVHFKNLELKRISDSSSQNNVHVELSSLLQEVDNLIAETNTHLLSSEEFSCVDNNILNPCDHNHEDSLFVDHDSENECDSDDNDTIFQDRIEMSWVEKWWQRASSSTTKSKMEKPSQLIDISSIASDDLWIPNCLPANHYRVSISHSRKLGLCYRYFHPHILVISSFVDADGEKGSGELDGLIKIGDILVSVNGSSLNSMNIHKIAAVLESLEKPQEHIDLVLEYGSTFQPPALHSESQDSAAVLDIFGSSISYWNRSHDENFNDELMYEDNSSYFQWREKALQWSGLTSPSSSKTQHYLNRNEEVLGQLSSAPSFVSCVPLDSVFPSVERNSLFDYRSIDFLFPQLSQEVWNASLWSDGNVRRIFWKSWYDSLSSSEGHKPSLNSVASSTATLGTVPTMIDLSLPKTSEIFVSMLESFHSESVLFQDSYMDCQSSEYIDEDSNFSRVKAKNGPESGVISVEHNNNGISNDNVEERQALIAQLTKSANQQRRLPSETLDAVKQYISHQTASSQLSEIFEVLMLFSQCFFWYCDESCDFSPPLPFPSTETSLETSIVDLELQTGYICDPVMKDLMTFTLWIYATHILFVQWFDQVSSFLVWERDDCNIQDSPNFHDDRRTTPVNNPMTPNSNRSIKDFLSHSTSLESIKKYNIIENSGSPKSVLLPHTDVVDEVQALKTMKSSAIFFSEISIRLFPLGRQLSASVSPNSLCSSPCLLGLENNSSVSGNSKKASISSMFWSVKDWIQRGSHWDSNLAIWIEKWSFYLCWDKIMVILGQSCHHSQCWKQIYQRFSRHPVNMLAVKKFTLIINDRSSHYFSSRYFLDSMIHFFREHQWDGLSRFWLLNCESFLFSDPSLVIDISVMLFPCIQPLHLFEAWGLEYLFTSIFASSDDKELYNIDSIESILGELIYEGAAANHRDLDESMSSTRQDQRLFETSSLNSNKSNQTTKWLKRMDCFHGYLSRLGRKLGDIMWQYVGLLDRYVFILLLLDRLHLLSSAVAESSTSETSPRSISISSSKSNPSSSYCKTSSSTRCQGSSSGGSSSSSGSSSYSSSPSRRRFMKCHEVDYSDQVLDLLRDELTCQSTMSLADICFVMKCDDGFLFLTKKMLSESLHLPSSVKDLFYLKLFASTKTIFERELVSLSSNCIDLSYTCSLKIVDCMKILYVVELHIVETLDSQERFLSVARLFNDIIVLNFTHLDYSKRCKLCSILVHAMHLAFDSALVLFLLDEITFLSDHVHLSDYRGAIY